MRPSLASPPLEDRQAREVRRRKVAFVIVFQFGTRQKSPVMEVDGRGGIRQGRKSRSSWPDLYEPK
jgi:hypothetical protein